MKSKTIKYIRSKNETEFRAKWAKLEEKAYLTNFCGEPRNWACFCNYEHKGKHYQASPKWDFLTIEIHELERAISLSGDVSFY